MEFKSNLKKARERMNLTQEELAKLLYLSGQAIYYYESGRREPSLTTLVKLSEVLKTPITTLLGLNQKEDIAKETKIKYSKLSKEELLEIINKQLDLLIKIN